MRFDQPPVMRVSMHPERPPLQPGVWPMTVPAVAQLVRDGMDPAPGVTFLVGENGSGKSTIVEALAEAYGLAVEGGSNQAARETRRSESPLGRSLAVRRGLGTGRWGFFLRAETMHSWYTYIEELNEGFGPAFHEMSHGESFLAVLRSRFDSPGFYCLDEPEPALSFSATLGLMARLAELAEEGGQVVCATHSPVLASLPGATILEVGPWGLRETTWSELELVVHWKAFLDAPQRYLRHVLD